jgi:hypothetical protein
MAQSLTTLVLVAAYWLLVPSRQRTMFRATNARFLGRPAGGNDFDSPAGQIVDAEIEAETAEWLSSD